MYHSECPFAHNGWGSRELPWHGAKGNPLAGMQSYLLSTQNSLPIFKNPGTLAAGAGLRAQAGEKSRGFPTESGNTILLLDLWKTRLIIFHLFACLERLRKLGFVFFFFPSPRPLPHFFKRVDFIF